jgi:hypothetical protein
MDAAELESKQQHPNGAQKKFWAHVSVTEISSSRGCTVWMLRNWNKKGAKKHGWKIV